MKYLTKGASSMKNLLYFTVALLFIGLIAACGSTQQPPKVTNSTMKAVIRPTALTAEQNVAGIELAISVPVGVSPTFNADGTVNTAAAIEITSAAPSEQIIKGATFTAPTATEPGKFTIYIGEAAGFKPADTITLHLNVAVGAYPLAEDFKLLTFDAFDTNGALVTGLNPTLTTTVE
jgi:hypothetical protein